ncbi:hypothetical protein OV203_48690 [Nannocystis sp. ILAH1]|uniref:helix-turn-helix domain-containing protein n=1 Tax=Nannocystis sp. ILAH1 TaxID=2996789 RepID=UPI00226FB8AE|nr:helix-turn-helix domain-containing protein [Nannocystis sp. ILAH1]MCY0995100.1 hypothetical protein [Nannocystis sp. ILAH1]
MPRVGVPDLNLANAERLLCIAALEQTGSLFEAAQLLGISQRHLARKIIKHGIVWPKPRDAEAK